jgi:hypothetical protein
VQYDAGGRIDLALLKEAGLPLSGTFYLCGPAGFMGTMTSGLTEQAGQAGFFRLARTWLWISDSIVKQREDVHPRSRGAMRPSLASAGRPLKGQEGAGKAGCALHPRSRVQLLLGKRHTSIQVQRRHPAFPARWVTAYPALSRVTGLSCHPHPRKVLLPANLTPASGCQDHTASPYATATLVIRRHRVHRIPPHVRDDREPPLSSGETGLR